MAEAFGQGFKKKCATFAETTFGSSTGTPSSATNPLRIKRVSLTSTTPGDAYRDNHGRTRVGDVQKAQSFQFSIETDLRPGPTQGTAPDGVEDILSKSGFDVGSNSGDTVQASPTPTATGFDIAAAGNFTNNELVVIDNATDGAVVRQIKSGGGTTSLVVRPAMTTAPTTNDQVNNGISYLPNETMADAPDGFSIFSTMGDEAMQIGTGCVADEITIEFGGDEQVRANYSGPCRSVAYTYETQLDGAINNSVTSITVDNGEHFYPNTFLKINSEAMIVTAVSGNTLTVTRGADGTSAAAHSDNDAVVAYEWAQTFQSDAPISSVDCNAYLWDGDTNTPQTLCITGGSVTIRNNVNPIGPKVGDTVTMGDYSVGIREVEGTLEGYLQVGDGSGRFARMFGEAHNRTNIGILIVCGTPSAAGGNVFALCCPQTYWENAEVDNSNDGVIPLSFNFQARGTATENDEISLAFL